MGKKLRSNQAELRRKMQIAKEQKRKMGGDGGESSNGNEVRLSATEIKERNDRKRFEQLLKSTIVSIDESDDLTYLTDQQEEEEINAYNRGIDRLYEGDPAKEEPFYELVNIRSENSIAEAGTKRLLPWIRRSGTGDGNAGDPFEFAVVICDPREKSVEFRETIRTLSRSLPQNLFNKIIFINSDTPAQNRRLLKKVNCATGDSTEANIRLFSDEKREWMREYTALGEKRWSMTMYILADKRVNVIVRDFSEASCSDVIQKAIRAARKQSYQ